MPANVSKRVKAIREKAVPGTTYSLEEGLALLKEVSSVKFDESVEAHVVLGVDPKKSDQVVRGSTVLPKGTGKTVRVAVFAQEGPKADEAKAAGADIVGSDDLAAEIQKGNINFDVLIATPDVMPTVGKLGQILGPKGMMPNPKVGTVTADVAAAVQNAKAGQVRYRVDKAGIIHCGIGKVSFAVADLAENINALITDLKKAKPSSSKGMYLKKIVVSSTMGPGLVIEKSSIAAA